MPRFRTLPTGTEWLSFNQSTSHLEPNGAVRGGSGEEIAMATISTRSEERISARLPFVDRVYRSFGAPREISRFQL